MRSSETDDARMVDAIDFCQCEDCMPMETNVRAEREVRLSEKEYRGVLSDAHARGVDDGKMIAEATRLTQQSREQIINNAVAKHATQNDPSLSVLLNRAVELNAVAWTLFANRSATGFESESWQLMFKEWDAGHRQLRRELGLDP